MNWSDVPVLRELSSESSEDLDDDLTFACWFDTISERPLRPTTVVDAP